MGKKREKFVTRSGKDKFTGPELRKVLENACRGMVYISETDAEISAIVAEGDRSPAERFVRSRAEVGAIETKPAEDFFERLTKDHEWHGDAERERVRRFRRLEKVVLENLVNVRMFRVGRIRIDIFVLGHDANGNIAGIMTKAVET